MKVIFNGHEVEIKAKKIGQKKFSKLETLNVLNTIAVNTWKAYNYYEKQKYDFLAKDALNDALNIHNLMKSEGYIK